MNTTLETVLKSRFNLPTVQRNLGVLLNKQLIKYEDIFSKDNAKKIRSFSEIQLNKFANELGGPVNLQKTKSYIYENII